MYRRAGGKRTYDQFSVVFRDARNRLLLNTRFRPGQSYQVPPAAWRKIRARSEGTVRVSVVGRQTDAPLTGPYRGCSRAYPV